MTQLDQRLSNNYDVTLMIMTLMIMNCVIFVEYKGHAGRRKFTVYGKQAKFKLVRVISWTFIYVLPRYRSMALVQGEDSESDEEINTEELHSLAFTPDGSLTGYRGLIKGASSQQKTAGIVMGEESETDEEEDEGHVDETDGGPKGEQERRPQKASHTAPHDTSRETSVEPILSAPQSYVNSQLNSVW